MKCSEMNELISAYIDDELLHDERESVNRHLAGCPVCRATLEDYLKIDRLLKPATGPASVPDMKMDIMAGIKEDGLRREKSRSWLRPALAATSAAVILILLFIFQPWHIQSPEKIFARAQEAISVVQSYRMVFSGILQQPGTETINVSAAAEYISPDRFHLQMTADGVTNEYVNIGGRRYTKSSNRQLSSSIIFDSSYVPDNEATLEMLGQLVDVEILPEEKIDGMDCFHYRGFYNSAKQVEEQIAEMKRQLQENSQFTEEQLTQIEKDFFARMRSIKTEVELWIGKNDYLIRQVKHTGQVPEDWEGNSHSFTINYYDFNQPVAIEPPLDSTGQLLPGWSQ